LITGCGSFYSPTSKEALADFEKQWLSKCDVQSPRAPRARTYLFDRDRLEANELTQMFAANEPPMPR